MTQVALGAVAAAAAVAGAGAIAVVAAGAEGSILFYCTVYLNLSWKLPCSLFEHSALLLFTSKLPFFIFLNSKSPKAKSSRRSKSRSKSASPRARSKSASPRPSARYAS